MVDFEIEQELQPDLDKDEKLIWAGRPKAGILFRSSDIFMIPFSILWCSFAFFWEGGVMNIHAPFFFKLWGIPFVCIGLYMVFGRFIADAKKRKNTIYGITNSRIIIKSGIFSQELKSLNIRTISDISISKKSDGTGTILLGPTDLRYAMMGGMDWPGVKQPPKLDSIDDAKEVYDLLVKLQRQ